MLLKPKHELNLIQTSSIIIGQVIGSGIFINVPIVAAIAGNPWMAVYIWFLGGLSACLSLIITGAAGSRWYK
ncbi:MAG TPA: hypothetical protein EYP36_12190 [Calditrichaeota bacterium]|nr:hypothetical protein [Calditrichota bacterium]